MSSSKSLPKRSKKDLYNGDLLSFDLLYQLTYLSGIAAAGIPRNQIFQLAGKLPCKAAGYFREVDRVAESMHYQYAQACRLVGESAKPPEVKSLLLRLSSCLATGEPLADFMNREAHIQAEGYANFYERNLESLRRWTDAYTALMISAAVITIVAIVSAVIYNIGNQFVVGLVGTMVGISLLGSWIIYRTAPREVKTLDGAEGNKSQRLPRLLFLTLMPGALLAGILLAKNGMSIGEVLIMVGALLFPVGVVSWHFDNSVGKYDDDISTFIRALGSTATAIGSTLAEALGRIDMRSLGSLGPVAKRLYTRLRSRVSPELCWRQFVTETGSESVKRSVSIFLGGVNLGGEPEEIGSRASLLAMKVSFLRSKRKLVSSSFGPLSLAIHAAIVFLLAFIIETVISFGTTMETAGVFDTTSGQGVQVSNLLNFNFESLGFLRSLTIVVALVLSLVNGITPKVVDGGYPYKLFIHLGATLVTTGLSLAAAPKIVAMVFGIAPT